MAGALELQAARARLAEETRALESGIEAEMEREFERLRLKFDAKRAYALDQATIIRAGQSTLAVRALDRPPPHPPLAPNKSPARRSPARSPGKRGEEQRAREGMAGGAGQGGGEALAAGLVAVVPSGPSSLMGTSSGGAPDLTSLAENGLRGGGGGAAGGASEELGEVLRSVFESVEDAFAFLDAGDDGWVGLMPWGVDAASEMAGPGAGMVGRGALRRGLQRLYSDISVEQPTVWSGR
ncbi:hypothetical protein T484DRAFT_1777757 [Baffinella frigidus]|nr:hypothetical protein T484DRAFT_1777757 [Cryptophyta sp. CCMP2293]